jgi:hypothetical protein
MDPSNREERRGAKSGSENLYYKPQMMNGWMSREADPMSQWEASWNLPGFTWRVNAKGDFGWNAAAGVPRGSLRASDEA